MPDPGRSTGRRLRPILLGLIVAVPGSVLLYAVVALAILAVGTPR